jgi:hypothetical protein
MPGLHIARLCFQTRCIFISQIHRQRAWGHMAEELEAVESGAQRALSRMRHV